MTDSAKSIEFVLSNEGGFVDNANDSGGATNFGLSLRFLRAIPDERLRKYGIFKTGQDLNVDDIRDLEIAQARLIYKGEFWDLAPFEKIDSQAICDYVFDMAVLHGLSQAVKLVQRGSWALYGEYEYLKADGIMGDKTLEVLNYAVDHLAPVLMAMRASFCRLLCEINPKNKEFLDGWLKRCYRI